LELDICTEILVADHCFDLCVHHLKDLRSGDPVGWRATVQDCCTGFDSGRSAEIYDFDPRPLILLAISDCIAPFVYSPRVLGSSRALALSTKKISRNQTFCSPERSASPTPNPINPAGSSGASSAACQ
jgi:hypothetical protein